MNWVAAQSQDTFRHSKRESGKTASLNISMHPIQLHNLSKKLKI